MNQLGVVMAISVVTVVHGVVPDRSALLHGLLCTECPMICSGT